MGDLGKVSVSVTLPGAMPNMLEDAWRSVHDLPASDAYSHYISRPEGTSPNVEFISDPGSGGYMVIPARKHVQVANYVSGVSSTSSMASPRIIWKVLPGDVSACVGSDRIVKLITNTKQQTIAPASGGSSLYPDSYTGPRWSTPRGVKQIPPIDDTATNQDKPKDNTGAPTADDFSSAFISQETAGQDVWWSIETTSLSGSPVGTPFYIVISTSRPIASKQTTFFALRIGNLASTKSGSSPDSAEASFELVFVENEQGKLYDLGMMEKDSNGKDVPASIALPPLIWDGSPHVIEFVPLAGRLAIRVDGEQSIYVRVDTSANSGKSSAQTKGAIPVYPTYQQIRAIGSNTQATLMLGSVCFPENAKLQTGMPAGYNPSQGANTSDLSGSESGLPNGVGDGLGGGDSSGLLKLPNNEGSPILGGFARDLSANDAWGDAANGKMHGGIKLNLEDDKSGTPSASTPVGRHYAINLSSEKGGFGEGGSPDTQKPNLCPVWFRARGTSSVSLGTSPGGGGGEDVSNNVMEINQSFSSPDRYHVTHSMDIVIYNENGMYDSLAERSSPIQVGFGWSGGTGASTKFFTGVILSGSKSLTAGKETLTLHCEDYMFLLEATLVINSPYYDGMDGFNIVQDMAAKANVRAVDDTGAGAGQRFYVPSGYSFLEPVKRYDPKSSVKECILDVCSMGAKCVYFDGDGVLHYSEIQGGIGFTSSSGSIEAAFSSDPNGASSENLVLDERRSEVKLNSTVNQIFVKAVDRTTRSIIMMGHAEKGSNNVLAYKKVMFANVPSLGSFPAVVNYIERLKSRVYKPIRSITIKTASDAMLIPMQFFSVDGEKYRLMSLNRSIRAEDNSISTTLTGEWMGAQG